MTGLGYTVPAVASVAAVVAAELTVLHTGLFRRAAYWLAMVIVLAFQIPVDGWLTKLSAPVVLYNQAQTSGVRFPWDIPIEDFLYGFALVTAALLLWEYRKGISGLSERRTAAVSGLRSEERVTREDAALRRPGDEWETL